MIPEGTYKVRAVDAALGYASTGTEQVAVELELLEDDEGSHITWYGFFTDKTTERTLEALRTLGWKGDDLSDLSGLGETEAYAVIAHEEDQNGTLRARVQWINAAGGLALKERMDEGAAKAFAERMKGHVLAMNKRSKGMPAAPAKQSAAANSGRKPGPRKPATEAFKDDDVPF